MSTEPTGPNGNLISRFFNFLIGGEIKWLQFIRDFILNVLRLVYADILKLSHYWVVIAGYMAMVGIALLGAYLVFHAEQALAITSGSGYAFAISLVVRCVDFGAPILYVMICILFSLEVSNETIKYILTRPVTRMELITSKYVTAMLMVSLAIAIFWAIALFTGWRYYGLGDLTENEYPIFTAAYMYREIAFGSLLLLIPFAALAALALMVSTYSSTMGGAIIIGLIFYFFFQIIGLIPLSLGITAPPKFIIGAMTLISAGLLIILPLLMPRLSRVFVKVQKLPARWLPAVAVAGFLFAYYAAWPTLVFLAGKLAHLDLLESGVFGEPKLFPYMTIGFPSQRFVPMYMLDDLPTGLAIESWWNWDIQRMVFISAWFFAIFFAASVIGVRKRDFTL